MTAEQFIKDYTNHCSNDLADGGFHEWLTPEQALRAVEIANDAFIEKAEKFLEMLGRGFTITDNITKSLYDNVHLIEDFKKYMEGE